MGPTWRSKSFGVCPGTPSSMSLFTDCHQLRNLLYHFTMFCLARGLKAMELGNHELKSLILWASFGYMSKRYDNILSWWGKVMRFECRVSLCLGSCSTIWATPSAFFSCYFLEKNSLFLFLFCPGVNHRSPPSYLLYTMSSFIGWDVVSLNCSLGILEPLSSWSPMPE
jgi:hypothetical protein